MATLMTRGGRFRRKSQGSCGCGGYFRPWGRLIWLPGKPPSIADGESHREGSCPAMTDGETNDLWNSISCETHSEGAHLYRVMPTLQYGSDSWFKWPQIILLTEMYPQDTPRVETLSWLFAFQDKLPLSICHVLLMGLMKPPAPLTYSHSNLTQQVAG